MEVGERRSPQEAAPLPTLMKPVNGEYLGQVVCCSSSSRSWDRADFLSLDHVSRANAALWKCLEFPGASLSLTEL